MTLYPVGLTEAPTPLASSEVAAEPTSWITCDVRLVADRVPGLRGGSTHKFYHGWRFEAIVSTDHGAAETTLLISAVDPAHLTASQSRYALIQLPEQGDISAGGSAAFSWSARSIGMGDPFAVAQAELWQQLEAAGWKQDAAVPTRFTKIDSALSVDEEAALSPAGRSALPVVSEETPTPRTSGADAIMMRTPQQPRMAGLDRWETDGGNS